MRYDGGILWDFLSRNHTLDNGNVEKALGDHKNAQCCSRHHIFSPHSAWSCAISNPQCQGPPQKIWAALWPSHDCAVLLRWPTSGECAHMYAASIIEHQSLKRCENAFNVKMWRCEDAFDFSPAAFCGQLRQLLCKHQLTSHHRAPSSVHHYRPYCGGQNRGD